MPNPMPKTITKKTSNRLFSKEPPEETIVQFIDTDCCSHPADFRKEESRYGKTIYQWITSFLLPLGVVFFPKCPICWATYLSLFGITGLQSVPYSPWLLPVFILIMFINLLSIFRRAKQHNRFEAFYLSCAGVLAILIPGIYFNLKYISYFGMIMIFAGSLLSNWIYKSNSEVGIAGRLTQHLKTNL